MKQDMTLGLLMGEVGYALAPLTPLDRNILVAHLIRDAQRRHAAYDNDGKTETKDALDPATWRRIAESCP